MWPRLLVLILITLFLNNACTGSKNNLPGTTAPATERVAASGQSKAIKGTVTATGKSTLPEVIRMSSDQVCNKHWQGKKVEVKKVDTSTSGGLKGAVVYLKNAPKGGIPKGPVTLDQRGCLYDPTVLALQVDQPLLIKNSDSTMHNVHALPKSNKEFNFGMASAGSTAEKKFSKPEVGIRFKCDVHGWMSASISVFDHPYFAVTDASGAFEITGAPEGTYTLEAYHPVLGTKESASGATDIRY